VTLQDSARPSLRARALTALALASLGAFTAELAVARTADARALDPALVPAPAVAPADDVAVLQDTLGGRSGKLRARFLVEARAVTFPFLRRLLGDSTTRPGVYTVQPRDDARPFSFISLVPFHEKVNGRIGRYRIGFWPAEKGRAVGARSTATRRLHRGDADNKDTRVSEHFKLADFLTHDQVRVWPKYLVLDEALVDKLELVLEDLRAHGYDAKRLHVMSGFRTPQYNATAARQPGVPTSAAPVRRRRRRVGRERRRAHGRPEPRRPRRHARRRHPRRGGRPRRARAPRAGRGRRDLPLHARARAVRAHRHAGGSRPVGPRVTAPVADAESEDSARSRRSRRRGGRGPTRG
jgi:hypothetical protein